ncbi:hypothetical protein LguiB_022792 [Lonicera macranthoides]
MFPVPFWVVFIFFLLFSAANSEKEDVKRALVEFMAKLSPGNGRRDANFGWNLSSDPCIDKWEGVTCDSTTQQYVKKIVLDRKNLTGFLDAGSLCQANSLLVLSLNNNNVGGGLPAEISNCKFLTHLYLSGNTFSRKLPGSLSSLRNLKRLDLSNNEFSDEIPNMSRVSGLLTFLAQNNRLSGNISEFDFSNLEDFNVSNNNLSGPIPDVGGRFNASSFLGNLDLCGNPLSNPCPVSPPAGKRSKRSKKNMYLIYSGYIIIGLVVLLLIAIKLIKRNKKPKEQKSDLKMMGVGVGNINGSSSESKTRGYRSEYSITSGESGRNSSSLVVLSSSTPVVNGMRFEDLLQAPAELVSRGKHGSLYKVEPVGSLPLVVKRIKDRGISSDSFKKRMQRISQAKHPKVLPVAAYYCSKQEKLLVYEFQKNGSLFNLLHGSRNGQYFDWGSRLSIAASIAEALVFMHEELRADGIAHGNLKSTNILLNKDMDPCISEYGLMAVENQDPSFISQTDSSESSESNGGRTCNTFKADIYGFGVILLELLTGKIVQNNGFDLAKWVHSVVKEEWTGEVFDKSIILEGANEERMVNLLQVALKCINHSLDDRPSINQVAVMISTL